MSVWYLPEWSSADEKTDATWRRFKSLYLIRHPDAPRLKVGISGSIVRRMKSYPPVWGAEFTTEPTIVFGVVLWMMGCENAREMERWIHRRFRDDRLAGEWFRITPEIEEMERTAKNADPDKRLDYLDGLIPFGRSIGWPDGRYRFRKNGRGEKFLASGGTLKDPSQPPEPSFVSRLRERFPSPLPVEKP